MRRERHLRRRRPTGPNSGLRLSVRLSSGVATRALGDPFASGKEEKRIDRLAFFVHTAEDGFQVYPPVPDDVTDPDVAAADHPNAVYLSGTPDDGYEATVALTAGGGYVADIIAIANLPPRCLPASPVPLKPIRQSATPSSCTVTSARN